MSDGTGPAIGPGAHGSVPALPDGEGTGAAGPPTLADAVASLRAHAVRLAADLSRPPGWLLALAAAEPEAAAPPADDLLLREAHHRFKNSLQMLAQLLASQAAERGGPAAAACADCTGRLRALAELHDLLERSHGSETVELHLLLPRLCAQLAALHPLAGRVRISCRADPALVGAKLAHAALLLVNEAVTNALKHAFPGGGGGTVSVTLQRGATGARLRVADDGIGTEPAAATRGMRLMRRIAAGVGAGLSRLPGRPGTVIDCDLRF